MSRVLSNLSSAPWGTLAFLIALPAFGAPTMPESLDPGLQARPAPGVPGAIVVGDTETRLPPGTEPERLEATASGWILSGVIRGEGRAEILLLERDAVGDLRSLPIPELEAGTEIRDPIPLIGADGDLRGLVWLEGSDRRSLGVRHAAWTGSSWEASRALAAPGPGSQLALDAARLSDGSHLLVWSRFDGEDDEILWCRIETDATRENGERLSGTVHDENAVPDITPVLLPTEGGALLAWSRYDGNDYRLHLARFSGAEWTLLGPLSDRGAVFPRWQRADPDGGFLVYRSAGAEAWTVLRVDSAGWIRSRARVSGPPGETPRIVEANGEPVLALASGDRIRLEWSSGATIP